ncbi:MAG: serine acetyltransferase [Lachnospiraceae bacterium]|nr:serine acetyltransferase [Lachnospiraceae bacterium]
MKDYISENIQPVICDILMDYQKKRPIDSLNALSEPDKLIINGITDQLFNVIYPGYFRDRTYRYYEIRNFLMVTIEDIAFHLSRQIGNCLKREELKGRFSDEEQVTKEVDELLGPEECHLLETQSKEITIEFFRRIPKIREYLDTDLEAFFDGDPAAENRDEIILCYPGFYAITVYRMAHELYDLKVPMLPRIMTEYAHTQTGIDINPGATIGKYFFIDHGTGIVIGETTQIGDHAKIYQGVTLGALSTRGGRKLQNKKRHPTLEDNVTIYSGASILGGDTVIGEGSVIGGNVFVTSSVSPRTRVSVQNQELRFDQDHKEGF